MAEALSTGLMGILVIGGTFYGALRWIVLDGGPVSRGDLIARGRVGREDLGPGVARAQDRPGAVFQVVPDGGQVAQGRRGPGLGHPGREPVAEVAHLRLAEEVRGGQGDEHPVGLGDRQAPRRRRRRRRA